MIRDGGRDLSGVDAAVCCSGVGRQRIGLKSCVVVDSIGLAKRRRIKL